jgi:hypothetical protein
MTHHNHRHLIVAFLERDPDVLTEDVVLQDLAQERLFRGREAVTAVLDAFFVQGFTGAQVEVQTLLVDEQGAALAFIFRGRQDGSFLDIPPTQLAVCIPMVLICRIDAGRITWSSLYYNAGTLLRQLGLASE